MRLKLAATVLVAMAAPSCVLWNPDYEPDPDETLRSLLDRSVESKRPPDAIEREQLRFAVERLAIRHPSHVSTQVAAGALALQSGERERAQGYIDRALFLEQAHVEARCLRVRIAVMDGSLGLARELVDAGLRLRPDSSALFESSAWIHQLQGQADAGLRALDAAAVLGAPAWRVAYNRGLIEELRGKLDAAEQHYQTVVDSGANCPGAKQRLAGLRARRTLRKK